VVKKAKSKSSLPERRSALPRAESCQHRVMRFTSPERKVAYIAIGVSFAAAAGLLTVAHHLRASYGSNVLWDAARYCEKMTASTVCILSPGKAGTGCTVEEATCI